MHAATSPHVAIKQGSAAERPSAARTREEVEPKSGSNKANYPKRTQRHKKYLYRRTGVPIGKRDTDCSDQSETTQPRNEEVIASASVAVPIRALTRRGLHRLTRSGRDYPAFYCGKVPHNQFAPLGRKGEKLGHGGKFICRSLLGQSQTVETSNR